MILVINGNPSRASFCAGLAEAYASGAREGGAKVEVLHLGELAFDPTLREGYGQTLEPDLRRAQALIRRAEHLVFVYPHWWGSSPAVLKGFIDRTFTPGFAYRAHPDGRGRDPLLIDKTGEIWITSDSSWLLFLLREWDSPIRWLKKAVLERCGVSPISVTTLGGVDWMRERARWKWLARAKERGLRVAKLHASRPGAVEPVPT